MHILLTMHLDTSM